MTFSSPKVRGHYGPKKEMREKAARYAWESLVQAGSIQGSGFYIGQRPRVDQGEQFEAHVFGQFAGNVPQAQYLPGVLSRNDGDETESEEDGQATTAVPDSSLLNNRSLSISINHPPAKDPGLPDVNPARLRLLRNISPIDESEFQIDFHPVKPHGDAAKNANLAPLGQRKLARPPKAPPPGVQVRTTSPRRQRDGYPGLLSRTSIGNTSLSTAAHGNQACVTPQKRDRDGMATIRNGLSLAKRQIADISRAIVPSGRSLTTKTMYGLMARLNSISAPLARVDGRFHLC